LMIAMTLTPSLEMKQGPVGGQDSQYDCTGILGSNQANRNTLFFNEDTLNILHS